MSSKKHNMNGLHRPVSRRIADVEGPDFYPTPAWVTKALIDNEAFEGEIWECACGDGAMAKMLLETGNPVYASDLFERGYGTGEIDFLQSTRQTDNIVTNPPFHSAEDFITQALRLTRHKTAFLLRLAFLEGIRRQKNIYALTPPARVWVFSERITFYPHNTERRAGSGTTAYAWFVWDKAKPASQGTELKWFKPGYKKFTPPNPPNNT